MFKQFPKIKITIRKIKCIPAESNGHIFHIQFNYKIQCPSFAPQGAGHGRGHDLLGRDEVLVRKPRNIEHHVVDPPLLLHPYPSLVRRSVPKSDHRRDRPASVSHRHPVHFLVLLHQAADGGLPVGGVTARRLHSAELRVLDVDEQAAPLAEVAVEDVPDDFAWPVASLRDGRSVGRDLEYEAVLLPHALLAEALRAAEHARRGVRVQALTNLWNRREIVTKREEISSGFT